MEGSPGKGRTATAGRNPGRRSSSFARLALPRLADVRAQPVAQAGSERHRPQAMTLRRPGSNVFIRSDYLLRGFFARRCRIKAWMNDP